MDTRNNQELSAFSKYVNEIGLTFSIDHLKNVLERFNYKQ